MQAARKLIVKHAMDHALPLEARAALERGRHDFYPEMAFALCPRASVTAMKVGLIDDLEAHRGKCLAQLRADDRGEAHARTPGRAMR